MEQNFIYVVEEYGGQYEDKWSKDIIAFNTREEAEAFVKEKEEYNKKVDDVYEEIDDFVRQSYEEIWSEYHDDEDNLLEGYTEEDYDNADEKFDTVTKYMEIEKRWGIPKDMMEDAEHRHDWDFTGYMINEIPLR